MFSRMSIVPLAAVLLIALAATPVQAQLTHVYQAKITCGYNTGDVPDLSDPNPFPHQWENFKPGNYATSVNITNSTFANQTVYAYLSLTDYPNFPLLFLGSATIPLFGTLEVGCLELSGAFPAGLPAGGFVEGVLSLFATGDHFHIDGVYTFESKDQFERHLFVGLSDGTVGVVQEHGSGPAPVPAAEDNFVPIDIAGSGAGGLGVGASIDVEDIESRRLAAPTPQADIDARATHVRDDLIPTTVEGPTQSPNQPGGPAGN